jgi:prolyl-tRNA synthetase
LRFSELGITTLREPQHPLLMRAGYVGLDKEFTALGRRLLARWFPGGVERRIAAAGVRPRHGLLVAREYLVAVDAEVPAALPTAASANRLLAESPLGDEAFGRCRACGYEGTEIGWATAASSEAAEPAEPLVEHFTPDCPGIDAVVARFADRALTAAGMLKCVAMKDGHGEVVVALVPGDREVRLEAGMELFDEADFAAHPELVRGYIGPVGLRRMGVRVVADRSVTARPGPWVTGANRDAHHVTGAWLGRDFEVDTAGPIATLAAGDPCPTCRAPMDLVSAFEAARHGVVGASRVAALLADACHDDAGLVWPAELAPFEAHLVSLRGAEDAAARVDGPAVLWDDRDVSPGVKFADADLLGMPVHAILGPKSLARGVIEQKDRRTGERTESPLP